MVKITDRIYISDWPTVKTILDNPPHHGISDPYQYFIFLCVAKELHHDNPYFYNLKHFRLTDVPFEVGLPTLTEIFYTSRHMKLALNTIHESLVIYSPDTKIIIFCNGGLSRSPVVVATYLALVGFGFDEAVKFVESKHPACQMNQTLLDMGRTLVSDRILFSLRMKNNV